MLPNPFESISHSKTKELEYLSGEKVFKMGDPSHSIYLVISGQIDLHRYTKSGDLLTIHRAFPNEYFAEASLFANCYHCDAVAAEDSRIISISKSAILELMSCNQEFSLNVTSYFARQIQDYRRLLELRSIKSAKDRVLAGLRDGLHRGNIMSFASLLGLTHEATYRSLRELVRAGHVTKVARGDYRLTKDSR